MTRIIAGRAGSLTLEVPASGTRPTSDRVRESLFGALESADALHGARVLDLYAGSGALGLEAVSRGATSTDLVERAPRAAAVLGRNAAKVGASLGGVTEIRVHRADVAAYLRAPRGPFDVVFIDPPYEHGDEELTAVLALLVGALAEGAVVIVERAGRTPQPALPEGLVHTRAKKYGDTTLWWVEPA